MSVQLKSGLILLSGGGIAVDPDCCCCSLTVNMSYSPFSVSVVANSPGGTTTYNFRVYKNGTLVASANNQTGLSFAGVAVANGDVVTATATSVARPDCVASASCTRQDAPSQPSCTYFDPTGSSVGDCLSGSQLLAKYLATTSRSAVISGLTGNMASLNGTYTVDCASPAAGANVSWTGGGYAYNRGQVSLLWSSQFTYRARITCVQSQTDSCVLIGNQCDPSDVTRRAGQVQKETIGDSSVFSYQFKPATCGTCTDTTKTYESAGSMVATTTSNGSPAESGTITWL